MELSVNLEGEHMDSTKKMTRVLIAVVALAVAAAVCFGMPDVAAAKAKPKKPEKVSELRVASSDYDKVTLKWHKVKKASYEVYRSLKKGSGYTRIAVVKKPKFRETGLETGTQLWYKVCAVKKTKHGKKSKPVSVTPSLKTPVVTADPVPDVYGNYLKIQPVAGADGYVIYCDDKKVADQVELTYHDSQAPEEVERLYKAEAYRYVGNRKVFSEMSDTTAAIRPAVYVDLKKPLAPQGKLFEGSPFTIKGKIVSNMPIVGVKLGAVDPVTDKWKKKTKYVNNEIYTKSFNIYTMADSSVKFGKLEIGSYKYRIQATLENGTVWTLMDQDFEIVEVTEPEIDVTGGAGVICKKALKCAWPYGTSVSVYKYHGGDPTDAYKEALNQAFPNRSSWSSKPKAGASCDVFVGTCVRASGYDRYFPRGLDEVVDHINANPMHWGKTRGVPSQSDLEPGDIIYQIWKWKGSSRRYGHIMIYLGSDRVANAHYGSGGRYGIVENASGLIRHAGGGRKMIESYVFRPLR